MIDQGAQFIQLVSDAYQHLYDPVHLRTDALIDILISDTSSSRRERAQQLHRILVNVIEELNPGPNAPVFSHEWRRHRLMALRYLDGLDPQTVADRLSISRRQYYREHESAIEGIASILWQRYGDKLEATAEPQPDRTEQAPSTRLELLRLEAARMAQADRFAGLRYVIQGVLSLLQVKLQQRRLEVQLVLPRPLADIPIDQGLLRQMILGIMGYLVEHAENAIIRIEARTEGATDSLFFLLEPPAAIHEQSQIETQERLGAFQEIANLNGAQVLPIWAGEYVAGFQVRLPIGSERTVLVVDDNEDVLELFHRYLTLHSYRVVTAQRIEDALNLARQLRPHAITLDLMMPGQDGWDLLQTLLNEPDTCSIPVIICSVLKQKELALSLGATAFLEKPVTEQALMATFTALTNA
jgi:CheY-like chemotaxis protein